MDKHERIIKQIELADIIGKLPNICLIDCEKEFPEKRFDFFLLALGFEERCLAIPEKLAVMHNFRVKKAMIFEYSTNREDNDSNRPRLIKSVEKFSDSFEIIPCDSDNFIREIRSKFENCKNPRILLDISVCSCKLLISSLNLLLNLDANLQIVYSEAEIYHPTIEEFEKEPDKWTTEEGFGIAKGVGGVIPCPEFPGVPKELPDVVVAFPTFKPERTKAIISSIDAAIPIRPEKRVLWIVGDPHMEENVRTQRKKIIKDINKIADEAYCREVSTLDYKKTIEALESIYSNYNLEYHLSISALGSKMQCLGISIFCKMRPDISLFLSVPQSYNARQYSNGFKNIWIIDFGDLNHFRQILNSLDTLELSDGIEKLFQH